MTAPKDLDPEGFIRWGDGCVCGSLYTYGGHVEPGQFDPDCPVHGIPHEVTPVTALGERSVQWRCPRMREHVDAPGALPRPCPECYSVEVTAVRLPHQPDVAWHPVVTL